jgi:hypothetical protein
VRRTKVTLRLRRSCLARPVTSFVTCEHDVEFEYLKCRTVSTKKRTTYDTRLYLCDVGDAFSSPLFSRGVFRARVTLARTTGTLNGEPSYERQHVLCGNCWREKKTLTKFSAQLTQPAELTERLNPFGEHRHVMFVA